MKVINGPNLKLAKLKSNSKNDQIRKTLYHLFSGLAILCIFLGNVQAQQEAERSYATISKVAKKDRLSFEVGDVIKYKLNTNKKERWRTKTITGINVKENHLVFGDETLSVSSIDKVFVVEETEFGKALNRIFFASAGLVAASNLAWRIDPRASYSTYRLRNFAVIGGGITAITAAMIKLFTVKHVYKLGKNYKLQLVNPKDETKLNKGPY